MVTTPENTRLNTFMEIIALQDLRVFMALVEMYQYANEHKENDEHWSFGKLCRTALHDSAPHDEDPDYTKPGYLNFTMSPEYVTGWFMMLTTYKYDGEHTILTGDANAFDLSSELKDWINQHTEDINVNQVSDIMSNVDAMTNPQCAGTIFNLQYDEKSIGLLLDNQEIWGTIHHVFQLFTQVKTYSSLMMYIAQVQIFKEADRGLTRDFGPRPDKTVWEHIYMIRPADLNEMHLAITGLPTTTMDIDGDLMLIPAYKEFYNTLLFGFNNLVLGSIGRLYACNIIDRDDPAKFTDAYNTIAELTNCGEYCQARYIAAKDVYRQTAMRDMRNAMNTSLAVKLKVAGLTQVECFDNIKFELYSPVQTMAVTERYRIVSNIYATLFSSCTRNRDCNLLCRLLAEVDRCVSALQDNRRYNKRSIKTDGGVDTDLATLFIWDCLSIIDAYFITPLNRYSDYDNGKTYNAFQDIGDVSNNMTKLSMIIKQIATCYAGINIDKTDDDDIIHIYLDILAMSTMTKRDLDIAWWESSLYSILSHYCGHTAIATLVNKDRDDIPINPIMRSRYNQPGARPVPYFNNDDDND